MPISRKRNELSVGVLTAVFLSIQFLLPLKVPGTFLWALLPTLIRINTAVLYSALLLCSTQLSDVKRTPIATVVMCKTNCCSHWAMLSCAALLFVPKNKEEQAFLRSSAWVSYCWCQGTFLACTKISPDWICTSETKKKQSKADDVKRNEICARGRRKKREQSVQLFWEYRSEETWERTRVEKAETAEYIRDIETT